MNHSILVKLLRLSAASIYFLLAILPFLIWFFSSPQGFPFQIWFGFTLVSVTWVLAYLWEPFLLTFVFACFLQPIFYAWLGAGLESKGQMVWKLALASNLLTIIADAFWIINGQSLLDYGVQAGLIFNITITIVLLLYWKIVIKESRSDQEGK